MTGIFLSLSRVLPSSYPLGDDLESVVAREHGLGRLLDIGIIQPRSREIFHWSSRELGLPGLTGFLMDGVPSYAWDPADAAVWRPDPSRAARIGLRLLPASRR